MFFSYVLGYENPSNKAARQGNICHKALEILARQKLAMQQGAGRFTDPELGEWATHEMTEDEAIRLAVNHYSHGDANWKLIDTKTCEKWYRQALDFNGGMFNPLNRDIVAPEQFFDFEIDSPWATYDYQLPDGQRLKGRLAVKGTIDLVTRAGPNTLEYSDYKSGRRINWATGKEKTFDDLKKDFQLLLYARALRHLYPDQDCFTTIFYIRDGGPFTIPFDDDDMVAFDNMLRERFEKMRDDKNPKTIYRDSKQLWKCQRLCRYFRDEMPGTGMSICKKLEQELQTIGIDRVTAKYGKPGAYASYGAGGGQENREGKK